MADRRKRIMMQGLGNPVWVIGPGEKACPQSSYSCNRSFSWVGDLAHEGCNATRKETKNVRKLHHCDKTCVLFCNICCKYVVHKMRVPIMDTIKNMYKNCFSYDLLDLDKKWVPNIICGTCKTMLYRWTNEKDKKVVRYSTPASWNNQKNIDTKTYVTVSSVIQPIETDSIFEC